VSLQLRGNKRIYSEVVFITEKDGSVKVEIVRKRPLHLCCQGGSPVNTTFTHQSVCDTRGIVERSFESVSKDKFTRRRRAAFDTDEKDVTKKDVKTPPSSLFQVHHEVIMIMKSIPFEIGSAMQII